MRAFTGPLGELKEYEDLVAALPSLRGVIQVYGCIDAAKPHVIYGMGEGFPNKLIVTFQEQRARELCEEYRFFDPGAVYYPAKDILFYQSDLRGNALAAERLSALKQIAEGRGATVITTFDALMNPMPGPDAFLRSAQTVAVGDEVDLGDFSRRLSRLGYEKSFMAQAPGEFAVRGGILDVYPLTEEYPFRIELWGDEVDSIRSYDPESQKSVENLDSARIYPALELVPSEGELERGMERIKEEAMELAGRLRADGRTQEAHRALSIAEEVGEGVGYGGLDAFLSYFCEERVSLIDYFCGEGDLIILDEAARCIEQGDATELEFRESMEMRLEKGYILPGQMRELFSCGEACARLSRSRCVSLLYLDRKIPPLEPIRRLGVETRSASPYNNSFELLRKDLTRYKKGGYRVILLSGSRTRARRLAEDLMAEGLNAFYTEDRDHEVKPGEILATCGKLRRGYEFPLLKLVVISESDIFGAERKKRRKRAKAYDGEKVAHFSDLAVGDYVVHERYGVGIYQGLEKIEVDGVAKDYVKLSYAGGSSLFVLATQLDAIQKYASAGSRKPKVNSLSGSEWGRTKSRVRGAVRDIAQDLVKLYAARQGSSGFAFSKDTVWQREFEEMFPFEETEDQRAAIESTKADMESTKIMDRLICGDVGYGKTEVAIRAAFKAVQDGKQVAFLAPTTILAQQHYNNFVQRMKDFPVTVDLLCRFRSDAEQKKTIEGLKKGQVDIVIGTHRLLSKDVEYKDLGLLVIDEEQRFGVAHKEKIKQIKTNVDVLALTATPIPRTLHMSLIGIRDMSVLEEPPMDRLPIQTYVMEYNEEMVREALSRELARGGQAYYVYNRVRGIEDAAARVRELLPDAEVACAHGQMRESELEDIMLSFVNGEIDILVSTTIIETGLDIPNANTLIVRDADSLGLAQLYQLRGRVGRSSRTSYAFLMYKRDKMLREVAEKRLAAIREYTELGSGFKVAMRDLEIRGAGNILGEEQHGHMDAVGYDLYCKMLGEAVREAKGEAGEEGFETAIDLDVDAYIPAEYVQNESEKLDIYKRIADITEEREVEEMTEELIDRFGDPPQAVVNLLSIARVKGKAHRVYVTDVTCEGGSLRLLLYEKAPLDVAGIPKLAGRFEGSVTLVSGAKGPCLSYAYGDCARRRGKRGVTALGALEEFLDAAAELLLPA